MPMSTQLRVRKAFAASFVILALVAASLGLGKVSIPEYRQSDKVLHAITFFLLTLNFYWIIDTTRRRLINLTLVVCIVGLGIGSEVLQGLLPNDRDFDPYDIVANFVGAVPALLISSWYHKRMLERKRASKNYNLVPGDEVDEEHDVELGERPRHDEEQESGITHSEPIAQPQPQQPTVTEELDNWDENAEEWDDDEPETPAANGKADAEDSGSKKRSD
ncbi:hypothetical protein MBLNU457_g2847t1 [Dothideomycetes sp. NU457]